MLEAQGIRKSYGGVVALDGVELTVRAGSVHALIGENGAGKSTLVKTLAGAQRPDAGTLLLDGAPIAPSSTLEARAVGVAVVSQELSVFPDLDVLSNLFPLTERRRGPFADRRRMAEEAEPVLRDLGLDVAGDSLVGELSLEGRQLIEIARALIAEPRVLILDEPTSALHSGGTLRLHAVLRRLRERGVAVVYVSHILEDVLELCDEVTVLRDGRTVLASHPAADLSVQAMVGHMLGPKADRLTRTVQRELPPADGPALRLSGVTVEGELDDVTLDVPAGRIVGIAGLAGSGYRTVLTTVAGANRAASGTVTLPDGQPLAQHQRKVIDQGVAFVTGDRRRYGVMLDKPIWDNVAQVRSVALCRDGAMLREGSRRDRAQLHLERLGIKARDVDQTVGSLSGGNQQKVVFAKWLEAEPAVLLLDDPTRGIDVGAKAEIYDLMRELAERGAVQLIASADPLELVAVCDEVVVMYRGRVCRRLAGEELTAHNILEVSNTGDLAVAA